MLIAENITKKFSGVTALQNVSLHFPAGKVCAVIGENGAGKSTLMKILSGVYSDYEGRILFKGKEVRFANPREAAELGIAIIHQELSLVPWMTVTENIFLGREILNKWGILDEKAMRLKASSLLDLLKLNISPDTKVDHLKVGQQQMVEIAKALLLDADLIIMDEPTSAITDAEVDTLFETIHKLRSQGKTIVYISHKLKELFLIADYYQVLRDGKSIESGEMAGMSHNDIIRKMVGRDLVQNERKPLSSEQQVLLKVENLSLQRANRGQSLLLNQISFNLHKGEILGIFGLMGAGRTELLETLFGLHAARCTGTIEVAGKKVNCHKPADAIKAGMALVPEDRKKDGLVLGLDVQTNMTLTILEQLEKYGLLQAKPEAEKVNHYIGKLQIKTPSPKQLAKNLSGGNQQKIVLAKWLATHPKFIMLDEPTRGIDINAKTEIYRLIGQLAADGLGVLVVSSEMPELLAITDRILVMCEGKITGEFTIENATEDGLLKAAIGSVEH